MPPEPRFDHYYRYDELTSLLRGMAEARPDLLRLESIGKSHEGRDLWLVTLTNNLEFIVSKRQAASVRELLTW